MLRFHDISCLSVLFFFWNSSCCVTWFLALSGCQTGQIFSSRWTHRTSKTRLGSLASWCWTSNACWHAFKWAKASQTASTWPWSAEFPPSANRWSWLWMPKVNGGQAPTFIQRGQRAWLFFTHIFAYFHPIIGGSSTVTTVQLYNIIIIIIIYIICRCKQKSWQTNTTTSGPGPISLAWLLIGNIDDSDYSDSRNSLVLVQFIPFWTYELWIMNLWIMTLVWSYGPESFMTHDWSSQHLMTFTEQKQPSPRQDIVGEGSGRGEEVQWEEDPRHRHECCA